MRRRYICRVCRWRPLVQLILMLLATFSAHAQMGRIDSLMRCHGLIDVGSISPHITVDLRYATADNFVGRPMYRGLTRAYLTPSAARALLVALTRLREVNPAYGLVVYDAARPLSVQRTMWAAVAATPQRRYVANPRGGGPHNYGMAVDVGLTLHGHPVDMGTPFDTFTEAAHITDERGLVRRGLISAGAAYHRRLLRRAMTAAGFNTYRREWWHFTLNPMPYARAHLRLLDF